MWCLVDAYTAVATLGSLLTVLAPVGSQNAPLKYVLVEERTSQMFVGNVFHDSGLESQYSDAVLDELRFQFLAQPITSLEIDARTGIIQTNGRIDRDVICPMQETCNVLLDVAVQPIQYFQLIRVLVQILDINDNWPVFPESRIIHEMLESSTAGFMIPTAQDDDSPDFTVKDYRLVPNVPDFEIQVTNKVDGSTEVRLNLRRALDREAQDRYDFQVMAVDGDSPPKTGLLDVSIIVLDTNDNSPMFTNDTYEVRVPENAPRHTPLVRVTAVDPDTGDNGHVEYGFSAQTQDKYGRAFGIDEVTGEIYIKSKVDHEKVPIYYLVVTARDRGADSLPTDVTVIVHVLDINDNAPQISFNTLTAIGTEVAGILENVNISTFVAQVKVQDKDEGRNGNFTCSLNDPFFGLKQIDVGEYQVITAAPIDREQRDRYTMSVVCRDHGEEPKTSVKNLQVQVTDVNDNSPRFSQTKYVAEVIENNYIGIFIMQLNATDADAGSNGDVQYSIPSSMHKYFQLDSHSGIVTAKEKFDRERFNVLQFVVLAKDSGQISRSATASVVIKIVDVNDESPEFTASSYSMSVLENKKAGYEVGRVTAVDKDSEKFSYFTYSFHPSYLYLDKFFINPHTGRINTSKVLDREERAVYYLTVRASDESTPSKSSTATLTIYVDDVNDNPPRFKFPNAENHTIQLSPKAPLGYKLHDLDVVDADVDTNAQLSYEFLEGNDLEHFLLDPGTGAIIVNTELQLTKPEVYEFVVSAKDHGSPQLSSTATLYIKVNESIPFPSSHVQPERSGTPNFAIVVSMACISGVVILMLLLAIVIVALRRREEDRKVHKYNCRMEALRMLTAKESLGGPNDGPSTPKRLSNGSVYCANGEKPKKEVSFSLDTEDTMMDSPQSPEGGLLPHSWSASPENMRLTSGIPPPPRSKSSAPVPRGCQKNHRPWVYSPKDAEPGIHPLDVSGDHELDSNHSGDGSNADSGRGPSEEGENAHRVHPDAHAHHPPSAKHIPPPYAQPSRISGYTPTGSAPSSSAPPSADASTFPWSPRTQPHLNTFATTSPLRSAGDGLMETNLDTVKAVPVKPTRTHQPLLFRDGFQGSNSLGRHGNSAMSSFGHSSHGTGSSTLPQRSDTTRQSLSKSVVV